MKEKNEGTSDPDSGNSTVEPSSSMASRVTDGEVRRVFDLLWGPRAHAVFFLGGASVGDSSRAPAFTTVRSASRTVAPRGPEAAPVASPCKRHWPEPPPVRKCREEAEAGDADSQFEIGMMHFDLALEDRGLEGEAYHEVECRRWMIQAAEQGDTRAQTNLGNWYLNDDDLIVPQDLAMAFHWTAMAARQGDPRAIHNLACMYDSGNGVPREPAKAVKLYLEAVKRGYAESAVNLGYAYLKGDGVTKDLAESVAWYRRAAGHGIAVAQASLGTAYWLGEGVPIDRIEGFKWWMIAALGGDQQSRDMLNSLAGLLTAEQFAEARRRVDQMGRPRLTPG